MQILKGNVMKSATVRHILESTNSYSNVASLEQLQGYLQEKIDWKNPEVQFDYFILYTNKTEEELSNIINWLDGKENDFGCNCILVTCKS